MLLPGQWGGNSSPYLASCESLGSFVGIQPATTGASAASGCTAPANPQLQDGGRLQFWGRLKRLMELSEKIGIDEELLPQQSHQIG